MPADGYGLVRGPDGRRADRPVRVGVHRAGRRALAGTRRSPAARRSQTPRPWRPSTGSTSSPATATPRSQVTARAADFWDTRLDASDCGWVRRTGSCDVDTRWLLFPSASVTLVTDKGNEHQIDLAMPPDLTSAAPGCSPAGDAAPDDLDGCPGGRLVRRPRPRRRRRPDPRPSRGHRVPPAVRRPADRVAGRRRARAPDQPERPSTTGPPMARGASAITPAPQPTRGAAGEEPRLPCLVAPSGDGGQPVQPLDRPAPGAVLEREREAETRRVDLEQRARAR